MVPQPPPARRLLLAGLRFATLAVVLVLLFEPVLRSVETEEEPPVLAVLVDRSQSLAPDSAGGARTGDAAEAARNALRRLPDLDAETHVFAFDADLRPVDGEAADAADSLTFEGARTDIAGALRRVEERFEGGNLQGVLLLSDGRYTAGRNPVYLAEQFPVPVFTATVGDTTARRDVRVSRVVTNEVAYAGVELPVRVAVAADGFAGERVTVALSEGGRVLAREAVTLPADGLEATVDLAVTPEAEGLRRYVASVTRLDGEATHANNAEAVTVRVLSNRRRVLLLAAAPGPDVAALRETLDADPNLDLTVRTQREPGRYYEGRLPARLDTFDLAVLAGFPGRATSRADAEAVAAAADGGLPLLFALTRQTDLGTLGAALGDALPVQPEVARGGFLESQLLPTAAGALHPVLGIPGAPPAALDRLPPVATSESRWATAPDARTLATVRVRGVALDDPMLVVRQRGGNRSAALLGAGTWRWRTLPEDLSDVEGFYPGLVQNLVRWLTTREDRRRVRVRPTADLFGEGEPVRFTGQVYDEALVPVPDASVEVVVTAPDGTRTPFPMRPVGNGRYELDAGALPAGDYTLSAEAERGGETLGADRGAFAVGALALEYRDLRADPALMREVARRSGGAAIPVEEIPALAARLDGRLAPRVVETERETELWRLAPLLALLVLLLAAEWVLRKRSGMV